MKTREKSAGGAHPAGPGGNLLSISPFFIVRDLQAAISCYVERLGFRVDFQGPEPDPYYGRVSGTTSGSC